MDIEQWKRIDRLLQAVLERPPAERQFSATIVRGDQARESEVRSLLASHRAVGTFLESRVMEVAARAIAVESITHTQETEVGPMSK